MAIDVQKLANRLKELEEGSKNSEFAKLLWKPKEGRNVIRMVPYKFNPKDPFIDLKFYYKLGGKNYLAPCTFGKPDPILETIETLRSSGSNEEKEIAAKLAPQGRTYAPIIVRGEEELGVRFWGFGVQVYTQLLRLTTKTDMWGDITSLVDGNDLEVEFHKIGKKKNAKGESFPDTTITPFPSKTPVVDPTRKDLMEKIKDQKDILTIFPLKSYEELKQAVETWLYPNSDQAPLEETPSQAGASTNPPVQANSQAVSNEFAKFFETK